MAVSKLWPVKHSLKKVIDYANNPDKTKNPNFSDQQFQALKDVLSYAKDEEKTEQEFFCQGINCNPSTARDQFVTVKEQFDKSDGIQAYHGYLSFKETDISPEKAQEIGMEFARRTWGKRFQVVVTTHLNTKHLHCHFVVNSVSFVDGKRLQNEEKAWFKFRHTADELCKENGLYYNPNPNRSKQSSLYYNLEQAGMPTPYSVLKKTIDEIIVGSRSMAEFEYNLKKMGYQYQLSPSRKYWTILPKGRKKPIRLRNLGEDYTNERIIERLRENRNKVHLEQFQPPTMPSNHYRMPTRETKIRKVGGLYGLYLYYCYKLGYLPNYKKQNPLRLHYLLRDDLRKLDELTAQTTLLGSHHIENTEQLFSYKASVEADIKALSADRTRLRNEIRKVNTSDVELSKAREQISVITDRLRSLRKEVKLCDGIAERSGVIQDNLQTVLADEEKSKRKENRDHEQRR